MHWPSLVAAASRLMTRSKVALLGNELIRHLVGEVYRLIQPAHSSTVQCAPTMEACGWN